MSEIANKQELTTKYGVEWPVKEQDLLEFLKGVPDGKEYAVVLGKGWVSDPQADSKRFLSFEVNKGIHRLSVESRLAVVAAVLLVLSGKAKKAIFSGGKTAGQGNLSEAQAMKNYALYLFGKEPEDKDFDTFFLVEGESFDTQANAENVKANGVTGDNSLLVTIGSHVPRAANTFGVVLGERPITVKSDDLIRAAMPQHRHLRQYDRRQEKQWFEVVREFVARVLQANKTTSQLMQRAAKAKRSK